MTRKFHERFSLEVGQEEARRRFVNRAHNYIVFGLLPSLQQFRGHRAVGEVERFVCSKLGERWSGSGCLSSVLGDNFNEHIRALESLYEYPETRQRTSSAVEEILADSEVDLGIRWHDGQFLHAGAPLLDERLVNDVLGCLSSHEYQGVREPFDKGLDHLLHSMKKPELLADVVTDMYEAIEALAKIVTGRDKDLSSNAEAFIPKAKLSDDYKGMLKGYIAYANKVGRHAGQKGQAKAPLSRKEVEAFVYLTGLFIRLAVVSETQV